MFPSVRIESWVADEGILLAGLAEAVPSDKAAYRYRI